MAPYGHETKVQEGCNRFLCILIAESLPENSRPQSYWNLVQYVSGQ